ncbi:lysozyme 1-like [Stomoxys calcitrans]|uniref:Glycosyl hydrolases family 22 (GH22) domain-containing protein n=1 Tax=Stomoxys calcitrans TaxID=35570 RepID=A0A1I8PS56_STOCA|nr:lysozyme 1-like [Stomoxys calcitrans]
MKVFVVLLAALAMVAPAFGRTMNRCSLAQEMYAMGVPKSELPQWTCIAEHESSYRTHVIGPANWDGSNDYGIFQINDLYWCQPQSGKFSYNECRLGCNSLLTDDIRDSVNCARQVKNQQGWGAWAVWPKCSGWLPSIDDCFW